MKCYPTVKKNEIMLLVGKWVELVINIVSEISQTKAQKDICMLSYVESTPKK
jgi:hypothetical protein